MAVLRPTRKKIEKKEPYKILQTRKELSRGKLELMRHKELPGPELINVKAVIETPPDQKDYVAVELKSTKGVVYTVVMPKSYVNMVPKVWQWTIQRYDVADLVAAGYPFTEVSEITGVHRTAIYAWLQHPEFKDHVDGLTLETGWANKRERIAGLNRVTRLLFKKIINEIDQVKMSDKSVGPILQALQQIAKQIGQEKEEFVEQSRVEQNTNISGSIGIAHLNVDKALSGGTAEERVALEAEFKMVGDDIIRAITGEKE